jgi:hypothetical protein
MAPKTSVNMLKKGLLRLSQFWFQFDIFFLLRLSEFCFQFDIFLSFEAKSIMVMNLTPITRILW